MLNWIDIQLTHLILVDKSNETLMICQIIDSGQLFGATPPRN